MNGITIKHIGINATSEEEALKIAKLFSGLLVVYLKNGRMSVFSGTLIEVMKENGRGTYGHIGFQVASIEEAMKDFGKRGISFDMDSIQLNEDGKIKVIYVDEEYAGFAIHLTL